MTKLTNPEPHPTVVDTAGLYRTGPVQYETRTATYEGRSLVVEQRADTLTNWTIHARVAQDCLRPDGTRDLPAALASIVRHTVKSNNFGLTPERALDAIEDPEFGWFLLEWLGAFAVLKKWGNLQDGGTGSPITKKKSTKSSTGARTTRGSRRG